MVINKIKLKNEKINGVSKRKSINGFTIIELIIVIAVIAVLAAVLIPTFNSLIKKANLSADQQAVNQMNIILSMEEVDNEIIDINQVITLLSKNGIDSKNYKPLTANTKFYWIKSLNRVVHCDNEYNILYPLNIEDGLLYNETNWFILDNIDHNRLYLDNAPVANIDVYNGVMPMYNCDELFSLKPQDDLSNDQYLTQRQFFSGWYADFAIILNDDFGGDSAGICGRYKYGNHQFDWQYMFMPGDQPKGRIFYLMKDGFGWDGIPYNMLLDACKPDPTTGTREGFNCGAFNFSEDNIGKSITVELRLYQPDSNGNKTDKYIVSATINCIFQLTN